MKHHFFVVAQICLCLASCHANEKAKEVILPGKGLTKVQVGSSEKELSRSFGDPTDKLVMEPKDRDRFPGDYWLTFKHSGLEALIEDKKILTLFFNYKSKKNKPFNGATEKGIGFSSSIRDVITAYGNPEETRKSVVSEFGEFPGAQEIRMNYDSLGVSFLFLDGELSQIIITKKR